MANGKGANPLIKNHHGESPLGIVRRCEYKHIRKLLDPYSAGFESATTVGGICKFF